MDESPRFSQSVAERERIVDPLTPSPRERATKVWAILKQHEELAPWDIICFTVEYLGSLISTHEWIAEAAKRLGKLIYYCHYYMPVSLGLITQQQEDAGCITDSLKTKLEDTYSKLSIHSDTFTSKTQNEPPKQPKIIKP